MLHRPARRDCVKQTDEPLHGDTCNIPTRQLLYGVNQTLPAVSSRGTPHTL
jgi:hypothetical protein